MCECGCASAEQRLRFPGPKGSTYVLALYDGCVDCDTGSAIRIERYSKGSKHADDLEKFSPESLTFSTGAGWPNDGEVVVTCGHTTREFIDATRAHIEGIGAEMFGKNKKIDAIGAETVLEEMYPDACFRLRIVPNKEADNG